MKSTTSEELQLQHILVPIDYSASSRQALKYAVPLAKTFAARLHLLSAIEPVSFMSGLDQMPVVILSNAEVAQSTQRDLEELARREIPAALTGTLSVQTGSPSQVIIAAANRLGVDLILLSTHGRTGIKRVLLGSTAERVIRHAPCPVLVFRRRLLARLEKRRDEAPGHIKQILVPVDFSESSRRALHYAFGLADRLKAPVTVLHVAQLLSAASHLALDWKRLNDQALGYARQALADFAKQELGNRTRVTTQLASGVPFDQITRTAKKSAADLIIMSTHGRTGFKRTLLGSTAENVVRHAPCPVLIVRERKPRTNGRAANSRQPAAPMPLPL